MKCRLSIPLEQLSAQPGKGDSQTRFASFAASEWHENIPRPGVGRRSQRREAIIILAKYYGLDPLDMVCIVRLHKAALRQGQAWPPVAAAA